MPDEAQPRTDYRLVLADRFTLGLIQVRMARVHNSTWSIVR